MHDRDDPPSTPFMVPSMPPPPKPSTSETLYKPPPAPWTARAWGWTLGGTLIGSPWAVLAAYHAPVEGACPATIASAGAFAAFCLAKLLQANDRETDERRKRDRG